MKAPVLHPDARHAAMTAAARATFAEEVRDYLLRTPRQLPSKYFYDDLGSTLFEAICRLPWYRITRTESALLASHRASILAPLPRPVSLIELGGGSGEKLAILAGPPGPHGAHVQLIDISHAALEMSRTRLRDLGYRSIITHQCTYEEGLVRAARHRPPDGSLLVLFLGSNIGNFDPPVARELLARVRRVLHRDDALLVGTDLVKPELELQLAYDDPLGVTAAFNRNLLRRINDELGGTFDLDGFGHRAIWNALDERIEMHLVSRRRQEVMITAANLAVNFAEGETIWTESSHKYTPEGVVREGDAAGFRATGQWVDERAGFALTRLSPRR
jgi:dimethylhistidine N-methyltransferase